MEYKTFADIQAQNSLASQKQGNALANMQPGRGGVASMYQLGGMLGGQVMGAMGQYSPEEEKAMGIESILSKYSGPPKTLQEAQALSSELYNGGYTEEATSLLSEFQDLEKSRLENENLKLGKDKKQEAPDTIADRVMLNDFTARLGSIEGAKAYNAWKHEQTVSNSQALSGIGGIEPKDVTPLVNNWASTVKPYEDSLSQVQRLKSMGNLAEEGNATAYALDNRELIKLVGDSQISVAEVDGMLNTGSISERVASKFTMWVSGIPTEAKADEIREVLNVIEPLLKRKINKVRGQRKAAYRGTGFTDARLDSIYGEDYEVNSNTAAEEIAKRKKNKGK